MKQFFAYISVSTIACMPRACSGMSHSEPARSAIANSARCSFSERSSPTSEDFRFPNTGASSARAGLAAQALTRIRRPARAASAASAPASGS